MERMKIGKTQAISPKSWRCTRKFKMFSGKWEGEFSGEFFQELQESVHEWRKRNGSLKYQKADTGGMGRRELKNLIDQ
jgi:hypothetical protein